MSLASYKATVDTQLERERTHEIIKAESLITHETKQTRFAGGSVGARSSISTTTGFDAGRAILGDLRCCTGIAYRPIMSGTAGSEARDVTYNIALTAGGWWGDCTRKTSGICHATKKELTIANRFACTSRAGNCSGGWG